MESGKSVFSVSVKYNKLEEGGDGYKKMNEVFLVHAFSYTDVEEKITEEMKMRTKENFYITNIKREKYSYVLTNDEDGGYFFNAVVSYSSLDDDGENQKKITMNMCIETSHIDKVSEIVSDLLKEMVDFTLKKVIETKIIHVIE
jgi:hypothetical protein